jgi:hypothetical protein
MCSTSEVLFAALASKHSAAILSSVYLARPSTFPNFTRLRADFDPAVRQRTFAFAGEARKVESRSNESAQPSHMSGILHKRLYPPHTVDSVLALNCARESL